MFERFFDTFTPTSHYSKKEVTNQLNLPTLLAKASGSVELFSNFEGTSFNNGLYRLHPISEIEKWTEMVENAFPSFQGTIKCFGSDWMGRQCALSFRHFSQGEPLVFMFDVGADKIWEMPTSFHDFHNLGLVDYADEVLDIELFEQWRKIPGNEIIIKAHQCVGYKVALFFGGEDVVGNLEIGDMEVYWEFFGQILKEMRKLPPGTKISGLSFRNE